MYRRKRGRKTCRILDNAALHKKVKRLIKDEGNVESSGLSDGGAGKTYAMFRLTLKAIIEDGPKFTVSLEPDTVSEREA